jgi:hypothetical protein
MLMFEVASFDIEYNCIHGRPFLFRFMAVIHTAYATIKMHDPRGVITLKSDQHDALACENTTLTHAGRFGKKRGAKLSRKGSQDARGRNPRQDGDARAVSRGHTQNACSKDVTSCISENLIKVNNK